MASTDTTSSVDTTVEPTDIDLLLELLLPPLQERQEHWTDRALCPQTDPALFFPDKGGSTREAKRVCAGCDVRSECLEYALTHNERFGIWGGLSEPQRRKLRKRAADRTTTPVTVPVNRKGGEKP